MKTIFNSNNRGKATLYILFAIAVVSFVALFFYSRFLPDGISQLALVFTFAGMMFFGGLIIQMRGGPPW